MEKNENIFSKIFVGIAITVGSAYFIWLFGFQNKEDQSGKPIFTESKKSDNNGSKLPISVSIGIYGQSTGFDGYGYIIFRGEKTKFAFSNDQVCEWLTDFKAPGAGLYNYEIHVWAFIGNHCVPSVNSSRVREFTGRGEISVEKYLVDGKYYFPIKFLTHEDDCGTIVDKVYLGTPCRL